MNNQHFAAGQVAVVTGAARGIGLTIAQRLAHQGVFVYLLDRDEQALNSSVSAMNAEDLKVAGIALDLTEGESVNAAFTQIHEAHGAWIFW